MLRPAMGTFTHESACVDPVGKRVYMTEDEDDGRLYRFTPNNYPDLSSGVLEIATVGSDGAVSWRRVPDPSGISAPTREQVAGTRFAGGEGMWFDSGIVYFTTKKDNKVHAYDTRSGRYELIYDEATTPGSPLSGLDGITVSRSGDLYLCEDGDDLDVCMITPDRVVSRFLTLTGAAHADSELSRRRLRPLRHAPLLQLHARLRPGGDLRGVRAVPGQRSLGGADRVRRSAAQTRRAARSPPRSRPVRLQRPPPDGPVRSLLRRGVTVRVEVTQPGTVSLALRTGEVLAARKRGKTAPEPRQLLLARASRRLSGAGNRTRCGCGSSRKARRKLLRARRASRVMLTAQLTTEAGTVDVASRPLRLVRR